MKAYQIILAAIVFLSGISCTRLPIGGQAPPVTSPPAQEQISQTEALMKQATCRVYSGNRFAGTGSVYAPQQIYLVINRVDVSTRVKVTVTGYIE